MNFDYGVQPDKNGQFVLYKGGKEVEKYPTAQAALNAVILEARRIIAELNEATNS